MEAVSHTAPGQQPLVASPSGSVLMALDHLTAEERAEVDAAVLAFAGQTLTGTRIPGQEPIYLLPAAPEVQVIVLREPGAPIQIIDIVRPATLRNLTHAR